MNIVKSTSGTTSTDSSIIVHWISCIDVVTNTRAEFYKSIMSGKEKEVKQVIKEVNAI
jgi:hypothetical protein